MNLTGQNSLFTTQCEAVLTWYFCKNLVHAMEQLSRSMLDGEYVPVPETSSQGVRGMLTKQAREFPKEKVNGLEAIITYLKDNKWWDIARPMDMAEDMLDMMQKTCWT